MEAGEKRKDGRQLSEAQTNIEDEAIGKHNEKVIYLLLIIYDGKYVLYFNNTRGVC